MEVRGKPPIRASVRHVGNPERTNSSRFVDPLRSVGFESAPMDAPSDRSPASSAGHAAAGVRGWREPGPWPRSPSAAAELLPGALPGAWLEELFALTPEDWFRRMPGRETFPWPGHPELVVKRMVGGEARDYWHEAFRGEARSPARREAENLRALAAAGLPVPRALAWVEEDGARAHPRRGGRSALVIERVPVATDLRALLERPAMDEKARRERALRLEELAGLVQRFHAAGWIHRDLYLHHGVLSERGELCLFDLGRARHGRRHRSRWYVKDLAALLMSAPEAVTRSERWRFARRWFAGSGIHGRAAHRRWAERVERKARRLGAHRPLTLDPGDPSDARLLADARGDLT